MAYTQGNEYLAGTGGRFGRGASNPSFGYLGGTGTRRPSGRAEATGGGGLPGTPGNWAIGHGYGAGGNWTKPKQGRETRVQAQGAHVGNTPGWLMKARRDAMKGGGGLPGIPGQRDMPEWKDWEGQEWGGVGDTGAHVDTRATVEATGAYLTERMNNEMADAAKKFGSLGMLSSGGGLGGGYMGTLGESQRGRDRDFASLQHEYDFMAAQSDADRAMQAKQMELQAFLSGEDKRYGAWGAERDFGWDEYGAGSNYDWNKYGAEMDQDKIQRQRDAEKLNQMFMLYGR